MFTSSRNARALLSCLALCLLLLPVSANNRAPKPKPKDNPAPPTAALLTGRLLTRGNQPVLVNGNIVGTGTTILTGALIQTFNGTRATVQMGALGSFELAPNSSATLSFGTDRVTGALTRGCAALNTGASVNGTLLLPNGTLAKAAEAAPVNVCVPGADAGAPPLVAPSPTAPQTGNSRGVLGRVFNLGSSPGSRLGLLAAASYFAGTGTVRLADGSSAAPDQTTCTGCCCCCCCSNPSPCRP